MRLSILPLALFLCAICFASSASGQGTQFGTSGSDVLQGSTSGTDVIFGSDAANATKSDGSRDFIDTMGDPGNVDVIHMGPEDMLICDDDDIVHLYSANGRLFFVGNGALYRILRQWVVIIRGYIRDLMELVPPLTFEGAMHSVLLSMGLEPGSLTYDLAVAMLLADLVEDPI